LVLGQERVRRKSELADGLVHDEVRNLERNVFRFRDPRKPEGSFFKRIFAPTEKLAPTGKVGALATLGSAQLKPTHCVGASWRLGKF
jgi:hypothetical protein